MDDKDLREEYLRMYEKHLRFTRRLAVFCIAFVVVLIVVAAIACMYIA